MTLLLVGLAFVAGGVLGVVLMAGIRAGAQQDREREAFNRGWVDRGREELKLAAMNPPAFRTADEITVDEFLRTL